MPTKEVKKLQDELTALKVAYDAIKNENVKLRQNESRCKTLEADLKAAIEERYEHVANCGFAFDFKGFMAFSIERSFKDGREFTSIGYLNHVRGKIDDNEINEWVFYCNRETHEKLVADFQESLKSNEK